VMLWTSTAWRVKDKTIATLLLPGGMLAPVFLFGLATATVSTPCVLSAVPVPVQSPLPIPQPRSV